MTEKEILNNIFKQHQLTDAELNTLHTHIEEHKYYVNESIPFTITFDQAIFSWYDNIFREVERKCGNKIIEFAFPNQDCFTLYFHLMDHWHYLKEQSPIFNRNDERLYLQEAIRDYVKNFSTRKWFGRLFYSFA